MMRAGALTSGVSSSKFVIRNGSRWFVAMTVALSLASANIDIGEKAYLIQIKERKLISARIRSPVNIATGGHAPCSAK